VKISISNVGAQFIAPSYFDRRESHRSAIYQHNNHGAAKQTTGRDKSRPYKIQKTNQ